MSEAWSDYKKSFDINTPKADVPNSKPTQADAGLGNEGGSNPVDYVKPYEVTTYEDFRRRSKPGDGLEGHEMWQHANINENGYATTRLSTDASKKNPVMALPHEVHVDVNNAQRSINARLQTPTENINSNAQILYNHEKVPNSAVDKMLNDSLNHYDITLKGKNKL
jgi:hypothetical protein